MNRLFLTFISLFFLFACNEGRQEEKKEEVLSLPPQYFYYPKANVYFDSANKEYIFLGSDGHTWQTAKQIPAVVQSMMDKSVQIEAPSDPVWKDNENHRLVYSAILYATPNDTVAKKPVATAGKKPSKTAIDSSVMQTKERKGFGKLLDKLFGRKKKDKEKSQSDKEQ